MDPRLEKACKELGENLSAETAAVVDAFLKKRPEFTSEELKKCFELIKNLSKK